MHSPAVGLLEEAARLLKRAPCDIASCCGSCGKSPCALERNAKVAQALLDLVPSQSMAVSQTIIPIDAADLMRRVADVLQGYAANHRDKNPPQVFKAGINDAWAAALLGQLARYGQEVSGWRLIAPDALMNKIEPYTGNPVMLGRFISGYWEKMYAMWIAYPIMKPAPEFAPHWRVVGGRGPLLDYAPTHWCVVSDLVMPPITLGAERS
jgi:hypothetical protein